MRLIKEKIQPLINSILENNGAFLVDFNIRNEHRNTLIELFIDNDDGVTIKLCTEISRAMSQILKQIEGLPDKYSLIVSSPGLDKPLKFNRQYKKNIGKTLSVQFTGENGIERITGELLTVSDELITIRIDTGEICSINFNSIINTYVKPKW